MDFGSQGAPSDFCSTTKSVSSASSKPYTYGGAGGGTGRERGGGGGAEVPASPLAAMLRASKVRDQEMSMRAGTSNSRNSKRSAAWQALHNANTELGRLQMLAQTLESYSTKGLNDL